MRALIGTLVALLVLAPLAGQATVWFKRTPRELVAKADLIVVGTLHRGASREFGPRMVFKVPEVTIPGVEHRDSLRLEAVIWPTQQQRDRLELRWNSYKDYDEPDWRYYYGKRALWLLQYGDSGSVEPSSVFGAWDLTDSATCEVLLHDLSASGPEEHASRAVAEYLRRRAQ